ncbi:MAG: dTDP-4-dehydrorhamnose 3,5-epimerase [Bacteroidales bacterium]
MKIKNTEIPGLLVIEPKVFEDARGYFYESYNRRQFAERGLDMEFVQDNESRSDKDVIRGLHYQLAPYAQTKLVRVLEGSVFDVAVDMRKNSPTYGKWSGIEISAANRLQLLVPRGLAHGFRVITGKATVFYKCDSFYHPESERGILFSDEAVGIDWGIDPASAVVSEKDSRAPLFADADNNFIFGDI